MSALIFTGGLQAVLPGRLLPQAIQAERALHANLANAIFTRFYAKLLIPRLGT
jgi:hypothetical protein